MPLHSSTCDYDSDLTGGPLMVRESRIVAELLLADVDDAAWKAAIIDDNCLQKTRPATARRVAQAIRQRLARLPSPFWRALCDGDEQFATQLAFCAALVRNRLLLEFLEVVVADAFVVQAETLKPWQWEEFLEERSSRDPAIARWSASTRKKIRQVAFRMLYEVGLIADNHHRQIQPLIVRDDVLTLLEHHHLDRIRRCLLALRPR
ncbi:DUF1819 family protein [Vreelandella jeotgali]|uniref:DUF1819 family protein n=1 Tax=Vreelandella jeotgali TaxID=553386 RepID=UPI00047806E9|nr:DUF1819 family protein [Halomonas jeotgali]